MARCSAKLLRVYQQLFLHIIVFCQYHHTVASTGSIVSKRGASGVSLDLLSPEFPGKSSLSSTVYRYRIESTDNGYVRLIFSDFHVYAGNSVKIYDAVNTNGSALVYSNTTRPMFQSSGSMVYMVYKVAGQHTADYIGWKAKIFFVSEHRNAWTNIPSIGLCPPVLDKIGVMIDISSFNNVMPYVDCVWTLKITRTTYLAVMLPTAATNHSVHLSVRIGNSSLGHTVAPSYTIQNNHTFQVYSLQSDFYMHLAGVFTQGSVFKMAYNVMQTSAQDLAASLQSPVNYPCQFKDCNTLYGMSLSQQSRCQTYWGSCDQSSSYSDPSCDLWNYEQCNKVVNGHISCYSSKAEVCDGFSDCYDGKDESNCTSKPLSQLLSSAMVVAGVIILLFALFNNSDIKRYCRSQNCLNTFGKKCCCSPFSSTFGSSVYSPNSEPDTGSSWNPQYLSFLSLCIAIIFILGVVMGEGHVNQALCKGGSAWCNQWRQQFHQRRMRQERHLRRGSRVRVLPAASTDNQSATTPCAVNTNPNTERRESNFSLTPQAFTSISRAPSVAVISGNTLAPPAYTEVDHTPDSRRSSACSPLELPPAYSPSVAPGQYLHHPASPPPAYDEAVQQSPV